MKKSLIKRITLFFATGLTVILLGYSSLTQVFAQEKITDPDLPKQEQIKPFKKGKPVNAKEANAKTFMTNDWEKQFFASFLPGAKAKGKPYPRLALKYNQQLIEAKNPKLVVTELGYPFLKDREGYEGKKFIEGEPFKTTIDLKPYIDKTEKGKDIVIYIELPEGKSTLSRTKLEIKPLGKFLVMRPQRILHGVGVHNGHSHGHSH